jgi:hypothetical protein
VASFRRKKITVVRLIAARAKRMRLVAEEIEYYCDVLLDLDDQQIAASNAQWKQDQAAKNRAAKKAAARKPRKAAQQQ